MCATDSEPILSVFVIVSVSNHWSLQVDELDVKHKIKTETCDPGYSAEPELKQQEMPERKMHSKVNIKKIVSSTKAENPLCNKYTYIQ